MHEIQKQILKQLTLSDKSRYSAIKPPKIGGNNFTYHLKEVIKNGLVKKEGLFYELTNKGKQLADTISIKTFTKTVQPKIVTMLYLQNRKGEIVICKRDKQPFINKDTLPYGKLHMGERIEEAAIREAVEKVGIETKGLKHVGDAYLIIYKENELITHMLCHIFKGKVIENKLRNGCRFENPEDISHPRTIPGIIQIINFIKKWPKRSFFREVFVEE